MPYYSELGLTSIPSSSAYSSLLLSGPYSNHSSIIASNYIPPKSIPRQYRGVYKPHLSTITELNTPLRRLKSPHLLYQGTPSATVRPIKKINTADIDVSVNRYKKYDKYERPKPEVKEKKAPEAPPSPVRSPRQTVDEKDQKEAKPNTKIRRDRATIRLQTVHNDTLEKEIGEIRSWRDNFKPEELGVESKRVRKTPGEILKEKFLIRSRSKENIHKKESKKVSRKNSIRKSPSFQEICQAITSDNVDLDLNPGQPEAVQRRQSRQISGENLLKQISRTSTNLSEDDLQILDAILSEQSNMPTEEKLEKGSFESRSSVRKKKLRKSDDEEEVSDVASKIKKSHSNEKVADAEAKIPLQRRAVKKRSRTPSLEKDGEADSLKKDIYQNVIRDISQVEIEQTAFKPKPVITGSGEIGHTETSLKAVVDDVEVEEAAKPKKEKKFRFNVIVEVENEDNYNRRSLTPEEAKRKSEPKPPRILPGPKITITDNQRGIVHLPNSKEGVVSSILKKRSPVHKGQVIEEKIKKPKYDPEPVLKVRSKENSPVPASPTVKEKSLFNTIISKKENASDSNLFGKQLVGNQNQSLPSTPTSRNLDNSPAPSSPLASKKNLFNRDNSNKEDSRPSSPKIFPLKKKDMDNKSASSSPFGSKTNLFSGENLKKEDSRPSSPGVLANKTRNMENVTTPTSPLASKTNIFSRDNSKNDETKSKVVNNSSTPTSPLSSKHDIFNEGKDDSRSISPTVLDNKLKKLDTSFSPSLPKKANFSTPTSPLASKINIHSQENSKNEDTSSPGTPTNKTKAFTNTSTPSSPFSSKHDIFNEIKDDSRPSSPTVLNKIKKLDGISSPPSPLASKRNFFSRDSPKKDTPVSSPGTPTNKIKNLDNESPFSSKKNLFNGDKESRPFSPSVLANKIKRLENASPIASKKEATPPPSLLKKGVSTPPATVSKTETAAETVSPPKDEEQVVNNSLESSSAAEKEEIKKPTEPRDESKVLKDENDNTITESNTESIKDSEVVKKLISKRSLVQKANKDDPDLEVFMVPDPEPEPETEEKKDVFVPLQSNRISQFMHPFKKPEQFDVCPVEIFARPKVIRGRHYPRPRGHPAAPVTGEESSSDEEDEEETEEETSSSSEEETTSEEEEEQCEEGTATKIGASTSSNDSGFGSGAPAKNKDCDVNIHKKCEKLTANLCGVNQKLVVEAIESVRKGSQDSRDSPTTNPANNPAFALDSDDIPEEYSGSSTYTGFQKSGRITPPATTIPRFRKYCLDDFNFLKVLGKGSFGKVLLAELKGTEYYYAIKCLKKDVVLEDDDVECTLIERKVLALGTKHPYLCHLLCTFQTESHLFFVMEYLNGGDLMFHIQASGRFPEHQARFYGAEIVSGLKFLHNKGIVYRDLKLDNVLLDFDGHVRIADFGMCKLQIFLDRMAETFCGTPDYMAPEIIKGLHYNQCVDWWSFGVLLYEMLLGQSPFSGCDEDELFWSICNEKPVLPRYLSSEATNILTLFLEKDGSKRLGNRFCPHGDIQDQPFFRPIDWCALEARKLEAPFKPNLQHPLDTQYFDKHFTVEKAKLTPIDTTILQSMDQTQFQGFSYTNPNATDK